MEPTSTLVPDSWKVTIGEETFTVRTFPLAKVIKTLALVARIARAAAIDTSDKPSPQDGVVTLSSIVERLPSLLADGVADLYRLIGLIVTPASKLRQLDEQDGDLDEYLLAEGRRLAYLDAGIAAYVELLTVAVQAIGIETILEQLPNLIGLLKTTK